METWLEQQKMAITDFSSEQELFININSLAELSSLESLGESSTF
jgi:molybdopterin-guanine dinucleotide biosynthesis protein A